MKARLGDFAARVADVETKGKVALVGGDMLGVIRGGIGGEADLCEHRIAVEEEFQRDARCLGREPASAGDIREHIGGGENFCGVRRSVPGAIGGVAVDPSIAHIEIRHHLREIGRVARAVGAGLLRDGIVGPSAGILEIPDIMAEGAKAESVLDVVPGNPSESVLADEAGDDNSHELER